MRPGVHVKSIEALEAFRASLYVFGDEAEQSLAALQSEIDKFVSWLEEDQIKFWRDEVRLREEIVNEAKTELHRCLQATVDAYRTPSCHHEKKVLDAAKKRLHLAEDKLTLVRRWIPTVKQAVNEYRMKVDPLRSSAVSDVPRAAAFLAASVNRLLEYLSISPPNTEGIMERAGPSRESMSQPAAEDPSSPVPATENEGTHPADAAGDSIGDRPAEEESADGQAVDQTPHDPAVQ